MVMRMVIGAGSLLWIYRRLIGWPYISTRSAGPNISQYIGSTRQACNTSLQCIALCVSCNGEWDMVFFSLSREITTCPDIWSCWTELENIWRGPVDWGRNELYRLHWISLFWTLSTTTPHPPQNHWPLPPHHHQYLPSCRCCLVLSPVFLGVSEIYCLWLACRTVDSKWSRGSDSQVLLNRISCWTLLEETLATKDLEFWNSSWKQNWI